MIGTLALVIWFVPIKLYALPIELPFNLEPYRLFLLSLVFAWGIQIVLRRRRLEAAGMEASILLLIGVAVVSTILNFDSLSATADESPINPVALLRQLPAAVRARRVDDRPPAERGADPPHARPGGAPSSRCSRSTRRGRGTTSSTTSPSSSRSSTDRSARCWRCVAASSASTPRRSTRSRWALR